MQKVFRENLGLTELTSVIQHSGSLSPFIITGKSSFEQSGARKDIEAITKDLKVTYFNKFSSNPSFSEALKGTELFKKNKCDLIISIGGGSSIDIGKIINVFQAHPGSEKQITTNKLEVSKKLMDMVAIPTTSGTGSEATHFAVCYINHIKYSIADKSLLPKYVFLSPKYTNHLPSYITACTGFDALSQAIESLWSKRASKKSQKYSILAIQPLIDNLPKSTKNPSPQIRRDMLYAAHNAGRAINITKTTAPHALSYAITKKYGVPHGHATALTLGKFFVINETVARTSSDHVQKKLLESHYKIYNLFGVSSALEAEQFWNSLMNQCGLTTSLQDIGVTSLKEVNEVISLVNTERLKNHPVTLKNMHLMDVFK